MIVVRTPLRVSLLGGGSDYPSFFRQRPGAVLGTAVNLYVYVAVVRQTSLADSKFRLTYRISEDAEQPADLKHPVVRSVLERMQWSDPGLHIATLADVPANTGLGSSSAFTVCLLHALHHFRGDSPSREDLAREAVAIEREVLEETGGWQDQFHAALGGFALYRFDGDRVSRQPITNPVATEALDSSLVLVPVGAPRQSTTHAGVMANSVTTDAGARTAASMAELARRAFVEVEGSDDPVEICQVLAEAVNESWALKKILLEHSPARPTPADELVQSGISKGALAGKLCGAGGSGFVAFLVKPGDQEGFLARSGLRQGQIVKSEPNGSSTGPIEWA